MSVKLFIADPFILPRDKNRLQIVAAASGMRNALYEHPEYKPVEWQNFAGTQACKIAMNECPGITNDKKLFKKLFVPAYVIGYHLGIQEIASATDEERETALFLIRNSEPDRSIWYCHETLKNNMDAQNMKSVYDLTINREN